MPKKKIKAKITDKLDDDQCESKSSLPPPFKNGYDLNADRLGPPPLPPQPGPPPVLTPQQELDSLCEKCLEPDNMGKLKPKHGASVQDLDRMAELRMEIEDLVDQAKDQVKEDQARAAEEQEQADAADRSYSSFKEAWKARGMQFLRKLTTIEGKPRRGMTAEKKENAIKLIDKYTT